MDTIKFQVSAGLAETTITQFYELPEPQGDATTVHVQVYVGNEDEPQYDETVKYSDGQVPGHPLRLRDGECPGVFRRCPGPEPRRTDLIFMNDGEHMTQGRIQKALSGFYYVNTGSELLTCRARGNSGRKASPHWSGTGWRCRELGGGEGFVEKILPRAQCLFPAAVANIDQLVVIASGRCPDRPLPH